MTAFWEQMPIARGPDARPLFLRDPPRRARRAPAPRSALVRGDAGQRRAVPRRRAALVAVPDAAGLHRAVEADCDVDGDDGRRPLRGRHAQHVRVDGYPEALRPRRSRVEPPDPRRGRAVRRSPHDAGSSRRSRPRLRRRRDWLPRHERRRDRPEGILALRPGTRRPPAASRSSRGTRTRTCGSSTSSPAATRLSRPRPTS